MPLPYQGLLDYQPTVGPEDYLSGYQAANEAFLSPLLADPYAGYESYIPEAPPVPEAPKDPIADATARLMGATSGYADSTYGRGNFQGIGGKGSGNPMWDAMAFAGKVPGLLGELYESPIGTALMPGGLLMAGARGLGGGGIMDMLGLGGDGGAQVGGDYYSPENIRGYARDANVNREHQRRLDVGQQVMAEREQAGEGRRDYDGGGYMESAYEHEPTGGMGSYA